MKASHLREQWSETGNQLYESNLQGKHGASSENATDFDWDAVEGKAARRDRLRVELGETLFRFIEFALGRNESKTHLIGVRMLAAAHTLYPGMTGADSLADLARRYKVSRADMHYHHRQFRREFKLVVLMMRSPQARKHMADAQRKAWTERGRKKWI